MEARKVYHPPPIYKLWPIGEASEIGAGGPPPGLGLGAAWRPSGPTGFFSFLYLKKIKISKIYGGFEKFQNYTPVAPCLGDRGLSPPGWATGPKRKKNYI